MDATPTHDSSPPVPPAKSAAAVVQLENLRVDSSLAQRQLAARWQRAAGIAIDLIALALLSLLTGPLLGFGTGLTIAALGSRAVSPTRTWGTLRWVLRGLGGVIMLLSLAFLFAGRPLVRTAVFNLDRAALLAASGEVAALPPNRTAAQLETHIRQLEAANQHLRESIRGSSWLNVVADFSRTLGLTFGWAGVYFTLCTAWLRGRTPGKWLVGTRVVRLDGRPLNAMDAFVRYGGYAAGLATGLIGFARLLWDPNRQAVQDKIGWTVVLRDR